MKIHLAHVMTAFMLLSLSFAASAHLENDNPRASIAFVGPHVITGQPGVTRQGPFQVRVIDIQGAPMAGLKVWFYNNQRIDVPENPPSPPASPGSFQGAQDPLGIITDANGVATSPPFRFGVGGHDVVAGVYGVAGPENAVVGFPSLVAYFHVNYEPQEPPPPPPEVIDPLPQGTSNAVTLPALSAPALAIFAFGLVILTLLHLRKVRVAGRRRK